MKKIGFIAIILCALMLLSSCNITQFDTDALLMPPQMNAVNSGIDAALKESVDGGYQLEYPKSGSYRDAITSVDLTGDGVSEALCFYTTEKDKKVMFSVLEKKDGAWKVQSRSHTQAAASIYSIDFFDFDKNGLMEIAVSWQYIAGEERALEIFTYGDNAKLESVFTGLYSNIMVLDTSLVTVSRNATTKSATASVIGRSGKSLGVIGTAALNTSVNAFVSVGSSPLGNGNYLLFIDEQLDNSQFTTEVLAVNGKNEISNRTRDLGLVSARNSGVVCHDIDGDGVTDIPVEKAFPSYQLDNKKETLYYMEWYSVKEKTPTRIMNAYTSVNEQFILRLPDEWTGNIAVRKDKTSDRQIHVYSNVGAVSLPMFSLRVFSQQEFEDETQSRGFTSVIEHNENVYAFRAYENSALAEQYKVDLDRFTELFKIIS